MTAETTRGYTAELSNGPPPESGGAPAVFNSALVEVAQSRSAQEVAAAMQIARRYPRDEVRSFTRIMKSCDRLSLAERACYAYPRGDTTVTGPSIRLAESLAQNWGNLDFGILELEQRQGVSTVMAYCWDLETNVRQTKVFQVGHVRFTRSGGKKALVDPRDIYEMVANQGARRLRACILGVIPGDIVESAVDRCHNTLKNGSKEPLSDRVRAMAASFSERFGVTQAMLERRLGHKLESCSEVELVSLRDVWNALRDGYASADQYFESDDGEDQAETGSDSSAPASKGEAIAEKVRKRRSSKAQPTQQTETAQEPSKPAEMPEKPTGEPDAIQTTPKAQEAAEAKPGLPKQHGDDASGFFGTPEKPVERGPYGKG